MYEKVSTKSKFCGQRKADRKSSGKTMIFLKKVWRTGKKARPILSMMDRQLQMVSHISVTY